MARNLNFKSSSSAPCFRRHERLDGKADRLYIYRPAYLNYCSALDQFQGDGSWGRRGWGTTLEMLGLVTSAKQSSADWEKYTGKRVKE